MEEPTIIDQMLSFANHDIHITGLAADGTLIMSDGGTTNAKSKETVNWILDSNPDVESIIAIFPKLDQDNVFEKGPGPNGSKRWKGTIKGMVDPLREEYTILYKKYSNNQVFEYDPIIQANP